MEPIKTPYTLTAEVAAMDACYNKLLPFARDTPEGREWHALTDERKLILFWRFFQFARVCK
jgi:hypothetical protein